MSFVSCPLCFTLIFYSLLCLSDKELPSFPVVSNLMDAVKQRVNLARDIDILQLQYKKATSSYNWVQKMAEEMDLVVDQDEQYPLHL